MGTKLNVCKSARKDIRQIEVELEEAVFVSRNIGDGKVVAEGLIVTKAEEIKPRVEKLLGKLEIINMELEKDSNVRNYYNDVRDRLIDFLECLSIIKCKQNSNNF